MSDTQENNGAQPEMPSVSVLGQYTKDFSFENPNAPASLTRRDAAPEINININVGATPMGDDQFAVELQLEAQAKDGEELLFQTELVYGGVFQVQNVPEESLHPFVMIECPRLLFPFARNIIADAVREGGFPPLMVDPVDFAALYRAQMMAAAEQEGSETVQ